jgi:vesicle-fusing ATPase
MLLYGPPGCGKTLIARELGKALNAHKPKVINGPEILNKYVGQSEENIRDLFQEAEAEQEQKGNNSSLHIIIFDEIDAICKQRGSVGGGTGVHDSVVNQLLSKMDGVNSLNNILVIGMTNRKDMIDSALLRPGRFEVKLEIPLPNKEGRKEILKIHTQQLREHGYLGNVSLDLIAEQTKNFTGAEIQGLVKEARSNALGRVVTPNDPEQKTEKQIKEQLRVEQFDFIAARKAIEPQFGIREDELVELYEEHGIIEYGEKFISMKSGLNDALERVKQNEDHSTVISVCLCSGHGSGKTAFTASFAQKSEVSFVKRIGADTLAGMSEQQKISAITTAFHDAYRSEQSVIILDDIERLIGKH